MRLKGKKAIITGAGSGIGRATAVLFAREGAAVAVVDVNKPGADETVALIEKGQDKDGDAFALDVDVSVESQVEAMIGEAVRRLGGLNVLVNCAALSNEQDTDLLSIPIEVFDRTLAINLRGSFLTCRYAIPELLKAGGGSIVNFTSGARRGGGSTAYPCSKGGVSSLTRSIAHQFAEKNIRANEVSPGTTETPMLQISRKKLGSQVTRRKGSIQRYAEPEEIANVALFLASDESSFVSASTYTADGGNSGY